jgi:predicted TIM-barrel fold metal-dependent hydrolase
VRYAVARAHNRGMAEFCSSDRRFFGVGLLPLDDIAASIAELDHILSLGLKAVWVSHKPSGGRSPGHGDLDPIWARMADAGTPFVLHVAGVPVHLDRGWLNNGRPLPDDLIRAGESVLGKDMTSLYHPAETFIGCMVLDGVLERHPRLRGGIVELGAGWVPQMLTRLDWVANIWKRSEPDLAALKRKPSEQIIRQLAFTPFPFENVGEMIRQSDERLYMFSSDYPHIEGGRAPLERFEAGLGGFTEAAKSCFYADNFARLFEMA